MLRRSFTRNRPVQEIELTPGPWYSTMAPVPPLTVKISATLRMTSLGEVQPLSFPERCTPMTFRDNDNLIRVPHFRTDKISYFHDFATDFKKIPDIFPQGGHIRAEIKFPVLSLCYEFFPCVVFHKIKRWF